MMVVRSPCIKECHLDAAEVCTGCFRSIDEIMKWNGADQALQVQILQNVADRKSQIKPKTGILSKVIRSIKK